jgi:hypothetical protein
MILIEQWNVQIERLNFEANFGEHILIGSDLLEKFSYRQLNFASIRRNILVDPLAN